MQQVRRKTTARERECADAMPNLDGYFDFFGPDGYWWQGVAANRYAARVKGWEAWLREVDKRAENRTRGVVGRALPLTEYQQLRSEIKECSVCKDRPARVRLKQNAAYYVVPCPLCVGSRAAAQLG